MACAAGMLGLRANEDGGVELDYDAEAFEVLMKVSQAIELCDGDLVCAGRQWLSFEAGRDGRAPRLHLLDPMGEVHMTMTIRSTSWTLGRAAGDVILPWDDGLSELHLQVLVREGSVFVQCLAEERGTWMLARPGEVVPVDSTLAVGDRVLRVCSTAPRSSSPPQAPAADRRPERDADATVPDRVDSTRAFVAA